MRLRRFKEAGGTPIKNEASKEVGTGGMTWGGGTRG